MEDFSPSRGIIIWLINHDYFELKQLVALFILCWQGLGTSFFGQGKESCNSTEMRLFEVTLQT